MDQYAAGIVLYNPDLGRLKENIDAVSFQVKTVYCFNNGSDNLTEIKNLISGYMNVQLIDGKKNLGIATALNIIVKYAKSDGFSWLLTLDQDSICADEMLIEFGKYTSVHKVGIICPVMSDKRRPKIDIFNEEVSEVGFCITSGSFMNLDIHKIVGGFDDFLFIGLVDDEYCYRLQLNGYKILQINNIALDHELGELSPSKLKSFYVKLGNLFSSSKIKALSYKRKVSPMRVYYATRNFVYLSQKYGDCHLRKFTKKAAIYNGISNVLRGKDKIAIIKAVCTGYLDGCKKNISVIKITMNKEEV